MYIMEKEIWKEKFENAVMSFWRFSWNVWIRYCVSILFPKGIEVHIAKQIKLISRRKWNCCCAPRWKLSLDPSLVCVKCVLRNRTFRIAAAARTRDSQMRVTIDTRRFSANSTNMHMRRAKHAHRARRGVRGLFSFFFFSFFSSAKSLRVQYQRRFS